MLQTFEKCMPQAQSSLIDSGQKREAIARAIASDMVTINARESRGSPDVNETERAPSERLTRFPPLLRGMQARGTIANHIDLIRRRMCVPARRPARRPHPSQQQPRPPTDEAAFPSRAKD